MRTRQRQCNAPGGKGCPQEPNAEKRKKCNLGACVTELSDWGPCDASCYGAAPGSVVRGSQFRSRKCTQPNDKGCGSVTTKLQRACSKTCPIGCPTANSFLECSGHGDCKRVPEKGCTQEATCRSLSLHTGLLVWLGQCRTNMHDSANVARMHFLTVFTIMCVAQRVRAWMGGRVSPAAY